MPAVQETVARVREIDVDKYKYGFFTDIELVKAPKGLSEDVVRFISAKKNEPDWLLDWRLEAYRRWLTMQEPTWANVIHPKIDFRISITTPRRRAPKGRRASPMSIPSCSRPTPSSAFRCTSRRCSPASRARAESARRRRCRVR